MYISMYLPCIHPIKNMNGPPALNNAALYKLEMIITAKRKIEKMAANSTIEERTLAAQINEIAMHG